MATKMAPPFRLVAKYLIAAVAFFVVLCFAFAISWREIHGFYFQPRLLALTHIATLGWITMAIFGALFQLVPVVLEVPLWSARLAEWQFWLYLTGVVGLITCFWTFTVGPPMEAAASFIVIAGYAFLWNMVKTIQKVKKWDLTAFFLIAGLFYFFFTISLGVTLAANLGHPFLTRSHLEFLKLHADLGLIGWVLMIIMGVGLKLIPMFALSHDFSQRPAKVAFVAVNVGLISVGVVVTMGWAQAVVPYFGALIALGILCYVAQIAIVLRKRFRKALDSAMKHSIVAIGMLGVICLLGVAIAAFSFDGVWYDRLTLLYGFLAIFGVISSLIIGQMYKIVPFLVWLEKYAPLAGTTTVPALKDLVNMRLAAIELICYFTAIVVVSVGILTSTQIVVGVGGVLLSIASIIFGFNTIRVFAR